MRNGSCVFRIILIVILMLLLVRIGLDFFLLKTSVSVMCLRSVRYIRVISKLSNMTHSNFSYKYRIHNLMHVCLFT